MGIVLMNLIDFALPSGAYFNPAALGPPSAADALAWGAAFVLVDGKMRALFSILFGASTAILAERAIAAGDDPAPGHYARMAALGAIGLAHGIVLWPGDILLHYALVGCFALPLLKLRPRTLIAVAVALLVVQAVVQGLILAQDLALRDAGPSDAWDAVAGGIGIGPRDVVVDETAVRLGPWTAIVADNARQMAGGAPFAFLFDGFETLAYFAIGMAALRSGFLGGGWSRRAYALTATMCLAVGLAGSAALARAAAASGFETLTTFAAATLGGVPLRPLVAIGYAALAVPVVGRIPRLRAAGRMTLSNYLLTSLAMSALFDGWGLGRFGRWDRGAVYALALPIWAVMLAWSPLWLARFRLGPAEWVWRSLAALSLQPIRNNKAIETALQER